MDNIFKPRVITSNLSKYVNRNVVLIGEVISMNKSAKTITIQLPDDNRIIVFPQGNFDNIELNLLTEVAGKLVSPGQIEAVSINQWSAKATSVFNKALYLEAALVWDAHQQHYTGI